MLNFKEYIITEIADYIVEADIIKKNISIHVSSYRIKIENKTYLVNLEIFGNRDKAILKIDFMSIEGKTLSDKMTNKGQMLLVLANVISVIKDWASQPIVQMYNGEVTKLGDVILNKILIGSKSEIEGDNRRSNIYKYYVRKNLTKLGVTITEEKNVTEDFKKEFGDGHLSATSYHITPIKVSHLKKI